MGNKEINLLKRKPSLTGTSLVVEHVAQKIAWWGLMSLLVIGLLVGGVFLYMQFSYNNIKQENDRLTREVDLQQTKEGILKSLKLRTSIVQKSLSSVKPWGKLFPLLTRMAPMESFTGFQVDVLGNVSAQFELHAFSEAITIVQSAIAMQNEHTIRNSELSTLSLRDDGTIFMGLTFAPVF